MEGYSCPFPGSACPGRRHAVNAFPPASRALWHRRPTRRITNIWLSRPSVVDSELCFFVIARMKVHLVAYAPASPPPALMIFIISSPLAAEVRLSKPLSVMTMLYQRQSTAGILVLTPI